MALCLRMSVCFIAIAPDITEYGKWDRGLHNRDSKYINVFNSYQLSMNFGKIILPILQVRKLAQDYTN